MTRSTKIILGIATIAVVLVAGAASLGIYYFVSAQEGMKLAREGYSAAFRGDHDAAIDLFNKALQRKLPRHQVALAYLNRGTAYGFKSRFDEAIRDYTEAIRLNPQSAEAYAGRGYSYQHKGELEKAIVDLSEAIRRDPNAAAAYYNRGLIFSEKGETDRALADFDEAVRCDPDNANPLVARGLCYLAKNDWDRALANFDGAIMIDPNNARAYEERANIYRRNGDRAKAEYNLAQAQRLKPLPIAVGPGDQKGPAFPTNLLSSNLDVSPLPGVGKSAQELMFEASLAYKAGDFDRTIELSNKVIAMNIATAQAAMAVLFRGDAYRKKGDLDKALRDFDQAAVLDPMQFQAYLYRALIYGQTKEFAKARSDLDEIPRLKSKYPDQALNSVAWIWATTPEPELRDGKKAVDAAGKACELTDWKNGAYIDTLGAAYAEGGDFDKAVKFQRQALESTTVSDPDRKGMKERLKLYERHKPYREESK